MKIIKIQNIDDIKVYFRTFEKCMIFGKGPTFQIFDKNDYYNTAFVCINETINYIDNCDLLVCNDIESIRNINKIRLKECANILIPYYIHKNGKSHKNIDYNNVISDIKKYFTGNLIVYNLKTGYKQHNEYISLYSAVTSTHTAFEFLINYIKNIQEYSFYGFAKDGDNTKAIFYNTKNNAMNNSHKSRHKMYIDEIREIVNNNNIIFNLN